LFADFKINNTSSTARGMPFYELPGTKKPKKKPQNLFDFGAAI
jgi:hypothetical protein